MDGLYNFSILRYAPDDLRCESLNVGALVFSQKGLDLHFAKKLDKVHAISSAIDLDLLRNFVRELVTSNSFEGALGEFEKNKARFERGPIRLSDAGSFEAKSSSEYQSCVSALLRRWVEPEQAPKQVKEKRTRLFSMVKKEFRSERVLAKKDEGLEAHRIKPTVELDEGLVADFVLKNTKWRVVETVDATEEDAAKKAIAEISLSAMVLERAWMKYGRENTKRQLVYSASASVERATAPALEVAQRQGVELVNYASASDRRAFLNDLITAAEPLPLKGRRRTDHSAQRRIDFN